MLKSECDNLVCEQTLKLYNKSMKGGALEDQEKFKIYMKDITCGESIWSSDGFNYTYEIITEQQYNNYSLEYNSYYIASGYNSTAIAIRCQSNNEILNNKILVLKLSFVKIRGDKNSYNEKKRIEEWNNRYYHQVYPKFKQNYGNLICDIYFYGDDITNNLVDVVNPLNVEQQVDQYKYMYDYNDYKRRVAFNISKYYNGKVYHDIELNKKISIKFVSVLLYLTSKSVYITDLKLENLCFENDNIICIDYDTNLFVNYKGGDKYKYKIYESLKVAVGAPYYYNNFFYSMINDNDLEYITNKKYNTKKYDNDVVKNDIIYENLRLGKILKNKIKKHKHKVKENFIYTNLNINFEKINVLGLTEILLEIFFEPIYYEESYDEKNRRYIYKKNRFVGFVLGNAIHFYRNEEYVKFKLNERFYPYKQSSRVTRISSIHNLSDRNLIAKFLDFIEPLYEDYTDYCNYLKQIIYDKESGTGLLSPEYDDIPTYEMVFQYLNDYQKQQDERTSNEDLFNSYKTLVTENLQKDDLQFEDTFSSNSDYYTWREERKKINNSSEYVINVIYDNIIEREEELKEESKEELKEESKNNKNIIKIKYE